MFQKVLIANRGEIAVRVARACQELGIGSVAVYSELDRDAPHVRRADEAYLLGPGPASESYLNVERLLEVIERSGAEAVHPGYGFLSENAAFAAALEARGIVFIGPSASAIEAMGSKTRARELMAAAGVPIVPGTTSPVETVDDARRIIAAEIGYPVAVKAAGGGGGKGFRVALSEDELEAAFEGAAREGEKFFADATVYLERYLPDPRHVEVQILADTHGNVIHLGERDCSLQRRHQKLIEEAPAPAVARVPGLRERIGRIGVEAAAAVSYAGAGTIEGLLQDGEYYFLEMNTRVQVEHCVTELVTGIDIVKEGIRVAAGEPLSVRQEDVVLRGHAIECRINAENAAKNFTPAPGHISSYREPSGPGVRVDSGVGPNSDVSPMYDPMIAKLVVWDSDRASATSRMVRALSEYEIGSLTTLMPFHTAILQTEQWARGETCRDLIEDREWLKTLAVEPGSVSSASGAPGATGAPHADPAALPAEKVESSYTVEVSGKRFDVRVIGSAGAGIVAGGGVAAGGAQRSAVAGNGAGRRGGVRRTAAGGHAAHGHGNGNGNGDTLVSPLQGTVFKVLVEPGAEVKQGMLVCVIEAMKMENEITAHKSGIITALDVAVGAAVSTGDALVTIADPAGA